ncbi:hypothetical protein [Azospirillum agricola]|uniref:hypothetical protein n=1 Tax=Azospirillum agricola TaxID=1720247 RepID=UPI000A0F1766|nr:hypothetical protein [Azospirillum agricola]SMH37970.1 hypothetical protein SAMN02982994_1248 [Azospirillum lipoferum]
MDARTRLAFFIFKTRAGWTIRVDGFMYPPCISQADALAMAIREARAAERLGFASVVLTLSAAGDRGHVHWSCGGDGGAAQAITDAPHPVVPVMAGIPPLASRSEKRP